MSEKVQVNYHNKVIVPAKQVKPVTIAEKEDLTQTTSFEDVLTSANDAIIKQEKEFFKKKQSEDTDTVLEMGMFSSDVMASLFGENTAVDTIAGRWAQHAAQDTLAIAKERPQDQAPSSLQSSFQQVNQRLFTDITPEFKELFNAQGKLLELNSLKFTSDFAIPRVSFEGLYAELVKRVQMLKDGDVSHVKLDLEPKDLGRLEILISMQDKKMVLHIMANADAKKMLDSGMDELKQHLIDQGFTLEFAQVDVSTGFPGGQQQQFFEVSTGKKVPYQEYDMLKIVERADIMLSLNSWLADVMVNYIA